MDPWLVGNTHTHTHTGALCWVTAPARIWCTADRREKQQQWPVCHYPCWCGPAACLSRGAAVPESRGALCVCVSVSNGRSSCLNRLKKKLQHGYAKRVALQARLHNGDGCRVCWKGRDPLLCEHGSLCGEGTGPTGRGSAKKSRTWDKEGDREKGTAQTDAAGGKLFPVGYYTVKESH